MGATGAEVLCLQEGLNDLGFTVAASGPGSPGNETTYFGPETEQALKKFQAAYGITADGYFGTASRVEMTNLFQGESLATIAVLQREVVSLIAELKTLEAEAIARGLIH